MPMRDYLLQQMRESSTWRGLVDIAIGVGIFWLTSGVHFLSSELSGTLQLIAVGFVTRGGLAVGMPDTTKAGQAIKTAQAIDKLEVAPPKLPAGTPNPTNKP